MDTNTPAAWMTEALTSGRLTEAQLDIVKASKVRLSSLLRAYRPTKLTSKQRQYDEFGEAQIADLSAAWKAAKGDTAAIDTVMVQALDVAEAAARKTSARFF